MTDKEIEKKITPIIWHYMYNFDVFRDIHAAQLTSLIMEAINERSLEKKEDDYHTGLAQGYKQGRKDRTEGG